MKILYLTCAAAGILFCTSTGWAQQDIDRQRVQDQQRDLERGYASAPANYTRTNEQRLRQQEQNSRRVRAGAPSTYYRSERQRLRDQGRDLDRGKDASSRQGTLYRRLPETE